MKEDWGDVPVFPYRQGQEKMERSILQGCAPCCGPSQSGPDPLPMPDAEAEDGRDLLVHWVKKEQEQGALINELPPTEVRSKAIQHIKAGAPFIMLFQIAPGKTHLVMDGIDTVGAIGLVEIARTQLHSTIKG